jgi:hypothetical protein
MERNIKTKCKICGYDCKSIFTAQIMQQYDVRYFQCNSCNFIQTEPLIKDK